MIARIRRYWPVLSVLFLLASVSVLTAATYTFGLSGTATSSGGTIACDVGPPYQGSAPAAAVAAGFTHCVANYDFAQTASFNSCQFNSGHSLTGCSNNYQWSTESSWNEYCGASTPLLFIHFYAGPAPPCGDFQMVDDTANGGASQVLKISWTTADYNNGIGFTFLTSDAQIGYPNTQVGVWLNRGFYIDQRVRLDANLWNATPTVCPTAVSQPCLVYDFWTISTQGSCPSCTVGSELDVTEMFAGNSHGVSFMGSGQAVGGGQANFPSDGSHYHTYGSLVQRLNQNGGTNIQNCWIYDNLSTGASANSVCSQASNPDAASTESTLVYEVHVATVGEGGCAECAPTYNESAFIQRTTIWACANYASGPCFSSSLATP